MAQMMISYALQLIRNSGGFVTTTESYIFGLLGDASHPKAKVSRRLVPLFEVGYDYGMILIRSH